MVALLGETLERGALFELAVIDDVLEPVRELRGHVVEVEVLPLAHDQHVGQLRVDRAHVVDARDQRRPPQRARRTHSLEAVDNLQPVALGEQRHRGELPVLIE